MNRLLAATALAMMTYGTLSAGTLAPADYSRPTVTAPRGGLDVFSGGRADAPMQSRLTEATLSQPVPAPLPLGVVLLVSGLALLWRVKG